MSCCVNHAKSYCGQFFVIKFDTNVAVAVLLNFLTKITKFKVLCLWDNGDMVIHNNILM